MKLLACDIGSTNLKLQVFAFDGERLPQPSGKIRFINHRQSWVNAEQPLEALSEWLTKTQELIVRDYGHEIDAMGFSTFREGLIGLSSANKIVFAGNNIQPVPLGKLEESCQVTTLAGWMCWKLTGTCCTTAGQREAGNAYAKRVSEYAPRWSDLIAAGENMQSIRPQQFATYLGGTDEQLGYIGTDLFDVNGPRLVIATGTFWSTSHIADGPVKDGVRRTEGTPPFLSVDSCVLYKWGPMIEALSSGAQSGSKAESVPSRFFGKASSLWFTDGESAMVTRQAAVDDLTSACAKLTTAKDLWVVVYGGGVRSQYARDLIQEACEGMELDFMDGDATLRGCAIIGKEASGANT